MQSIPFPIFLCPCKSTFCIDFAKKHHYSLGSGFDQFGNSRPLLIFFALAPGVQAFEGMSFEVLKLVVAKAILDNVLCEMCEYFPNFRRLLLLALWPRHGCNNDIGSGFDDARQFRFCLEICDEINSLHFSLLSHFLVVQDSKPR